MYVRRAGENVNKGKIYVLVKNFSGVNQDVEILGNFKDAKMAF